MSRSIAKTLATLVILHPQNYKASGSRPMRVGAPKSLDASGCSSEIPTMTQIFTSIVTGPHTMHFGARLTRAISQGPTKFPVQVGVK